MRGIARYFVFVISVLWSQPGFAQEEHLSGIELQFSEIEENIASGKYDESLYLINGIENRDRETPDLGYIQKVNLAYLKAFLSITSEGSYRLSGQDSALLHRKPADRAEIPALLQAKILHLKGLYFTTHPHRNLDSSICYFRWAAEKIGDSREPSALKFRIGLLENIGKAYYYKGEWLNAIPKIEEAFALRKRLPDPEDPELAKSYASYAAILIQTGETAKSKEYSEEALRIYGENGQAENQDVVSVYLTIANAHLVEGEWATARLFYDKALCLNLKYEPDNSRLSADINRYIVQTLFREGKYSRGLKEMDMLLRAAKASEEFGISDMASLYVTFAIELYETGKLPASEQLLTEALQMFGTDPHVYLPDYLTGVYYYVRLLIDQKRWSEAEKFNRSYYELSVQVYGDRHWGSCYYHYFRGKILLAANRFDEARKEMSKCIAFLEGENLMSAAQSDDALTLADAYTTISRSFLMQYGLIPDKKYLHEARENAHKANGIVLALQESKLSPEDKIRVRKYLPQVLEVILLTEKASPSPDLPYILSQMDQGRNQILKGSLPEVGDVSFARVPGEVLQKWKALKDSVAFLDRQWQNRVSGEYRRKLQESYLSAVRNLKSHQEFISREYPGIYRLKKMQSDLDVTSLKEELGTNKAVIQYFWGEEHVFIYYLDSRREEFRSLLKDDLFNLAVSDFKNAVSDPASDNSSYFRSAYILYRALLQPLGDLPEVLIIVPDGILSYLPFEAFLTKEVTAANDFRKLPYLMKDHVISYNASLKLLDIMKAGEKRTGKLLALAPQFNNQEYITSGDTIDFGDLVHSEAEVKAVSRYFSGSFYSGNQATKSNLLRDISSHSILHLATHAWSDEKNHKASFLAFSAEEDNENLLFFEDIYGMDWPLDMVVLSAYLQGEGIASLTRAFASAGAKAMTISLWPANDRSAEQIMTTFYEKLSAGRQKDKALQQAKTEYLKGILAVDKAHPYYWSNFILYGDTASIERPGTPAYFFAALVLIMIIAVIVMLMRLK